MRPPENMIRIIDRKRYNTSTATLIADDVYRDGHDTERGGTNSFLYRSPKGAYFVVTLTQWQGSQDTLRPISRNEAIDLWEGPLSEHYMDFEEAFPSIDVEEQESFRSGTAPNTSLWLDDAQRAWLQGQGGIQPTIRRLIDEAMRQ